MSDGYAVSRSYDNRLRCWALLLRKAQGLEDGLVRRFAAFGQRVLAVFLILGRAVPIWAAREGSPLSNGTLRAQLVRTVGTHHQCLS
jgi:hypothetical protein